MLGAMAQAESPSRQRKRDNYIDAWISFRGLKPGAVLTATGAPKDLVWKWRKKNNFPTEEYLASLLDLLKTERECLFSPPPGGDGEGVEGAFIGYKNETVTESEPLKLKGTIPKEMIFEVLLRMEGVDLGRAEAALAALTGEPNRAPPTPERPAADDQSASAIPRRVSPASSPRAISRRVRQRQPD